MSNWHTCTRTTTVHFHIVLYW